MTRGGRLATLDCDHCAGTAVTCGNNYGLFGEDDSGPCETCGMPGNVTIEDGDEDCEEDGDLTYAVWLSDETGRCAQADCAECREAPTPRPPGAS